MRPTFMTFGAVVLAFVLAAIAARIARLIVQRLLGALEIVGAHNRDAVQARARQLVRALTLLAYGVAAVASISLALARLGVNEPRFDPRAASAWALSHGVNILIILIGGWVVVRAASVVIEHLQHKLALR